MPTKIKYAYLKEQTWLYRRHYPKDVALVLGTPALKRSLKTGDPKRAAARASELNLKVEDQIARVRQGITVTLDSGASWDGDARGCLDALRAALGTEAVETDFRDRKPKAIPTVGDLATLYLRKRAGETR